MSDEELNPCAYCIYVSEATDSCGHDYYQCELDDNPDNYSNAMCNNTFIIEEV